MVVRVRFAPSPTGLLHIGNARAAVVNWLFAAKEKGEFWLRYDDTDTERSTPEFAQKIARDLAWLTIQPVQQFRQADRLGVYEKAADDLRARGYLYPCYESAEELAFKRKQQMARGKPPRYDRAALKLTEAERATYEAQGRRPHWRFKLDDQDVHWVDLIRGPVTISAATLSDPVLIREDGMPLYTFASVVDDLEFNITHIIRGEDHVTNTAVQLQLARALAPDAPFCQFAHFTLVTDQDGQGFSKRLGSLSLESLAAEGIEPLTILNFLAKVGTSDAIEPHSWPELVEAFDLGKFARSSPKFDPADLWILNKKILHKMPYAEVQAQLQRLQLQDVTPVLWEAVRGNLDRLQDVAMWRDVCLQPFQPPAGGEEVRHPAADLLPDVWTEESWTPLIDALKQVTGLKGKALFMPLRQALTGLEHGPELKDLIAVMGPERARARLRGEKA